jgi:hypothetical protein
VSAAETRSRDSSVKWFKNTCVRRNSDLQLNGVISRVMYVDKILRTINRCNTRIDIKRSTQILALLL